MDPTSGAGVRDNRFIGRRDELLAFERALDRAVEGTGSVLLMAGEPGIGKTRLAAEASRVAKSRGFKILWGRAWEAGGAPAFWPWAEVISRYASEIDDQGLRADAGPHAKRIASIAPDLADRLGVSPTSSAETESEKFLMFDAVTHLLRAASGVGPILVVLDDLHAADASSLLLLQFLAGRIQESSLLVVAAFREGPQDISARSQRILAEISAVAERIDLGGLDTTDTLEFVASQIDRQVTAEVLMAIHEKTAGNPLFLDEVLRTLSASSASGDLTAVSIRIPSHLRDQIRRRLESFSDELLSVLGVASVMGRDFDLHTVSKIAMTPEPKLEQLLEEAERSGILTRSELASYSFAHVLFQETLYEHLPSTTRTDLHVKIAQALANSPDTNEHAASVASHYMRVAAVGYADEAYAWLRRAGEAAIRSYAFDEAVAHLERALSLSDQMNFAPERRVDLLLPLGKAMRLAGDDRARATLRKAAELARDNELSKPFALAVLEFTPSLGSINPTDREMPDTVEAALQVLGEDDMELRARLLCRWAILSFWVPELAELRSARLAEAKTLAEQVGGSIEALIATSDLVIHESLPHDGMITEAQEVLRVAESSDNVELILEARSLLIHRRLLLGDRLNAMEDTIYYSRVANDLRSPFHSWLSMMVRAGNHLLAGELDQAVALSDEALQMGTTAPIYDPFIYWGGLRGSMWMTMREPGWFSQFIPFMESAVQMYPSQAIPRLGFVHYHAYQGQLTEARDWLDTLGPDLIERLPRDPRWLGAMSMLGEIAFLLEDEGLGGRVLEEIEPYSTFLAFQSRGSTLWGIPRLSAATAAAAAGMHDRAEAHFEAALRVTATTQIKPYQGHSHFYFGWSLAKSGEVARAKTHLARARSIFKGLGMEYPAARANDLIESLAAHDAEPGVAVLKRHGDVWLVGMSGTTFHMKDIKGLHHLSRLIAVPDREISALDLTSETSGDRARDTSELHSGALDPGLEAIDAQARRAYTARIKELQSEIDEAYDDGLRSKLQEEMDVLVQTLSSAIGLGGRSRKTSSAAEKARLSVTRAIRSAIDRIAERDLVLGKHLDVSIRTGTFCSYSPDVSSKIRWDL